MTAVGPGTFFPAPGPPEDSGGQDRTRPQPIHSEIDPGTVGAGRVWIVDSSGAMFVRNDANTAWVSAGGVGVVPTFGLVGDIVAETAGATASAGATGKIADAGHRHAAARSAPVAEAIGSTQATGASGDFADAQHRHAMPSAAAPAAEALGSAQTTGASGSFADAAHVHALAASAAVPLVESGAGSAGASTTASRDDHVHPAVAATAIIRGTVNADGTIFNGSGFSVARTAAGQYTITWSVAFATQPVITTALVDFDSVSHVQASPRKVAGGAGSTNWGLSTVEILVGLSGVALLDNAFCFIAIGS